jgi:hypothetical protein
VRGNQNRSSLAQAFQPAARALCGRSRPIFRSIGAGRPSANRRGQGRGVVFHLISRPVRTGQGSLNAPADMAAGDDTLRALLMEIAMDAASQAGAIADTIQGAFAVQMEDARRHAPEHQRAAILQGLALARDSALSAAAAKAALDVHGRQQAAIAIRLAQQPPARGNARHRQQGAQRSTVFVVATRSTEVHTEADAKNLAECRRAAGRQLFRQAAKIATRRPTVLPRRKLRGGRRGESAQSFRPAARAFTRHVSEIPAAADGVATFLATTHDWFELWDAATVGHHEHSDYFNATEKYLSPGL